MPTSFLMRAILAAIAISAAPAIANAQAPQTKHARSTAKAPVHHAKVERREARAGKKTKKAKKRASSSRLPVPEHPNGRAKW